MSLFVNNLLTFLFHLCLHTLTPPPCKEVTVAFERDFYHVNEEDSVVELTVIITGTVIDSPVSLRVLTSELNPLSAAGTKATHTHTRTHTPSVLHLLP